MKGRYLLSALVSSGLVLGSGQISQVQESMPQGITETLDHSDEWIERETQKLLTIPSEVFPEDEFFFHQAKALASEEDYIVIRGYDSGFMESTDARIFLRFALVSGSADIYALLPEGLDTVLDEIQRELDKETHDNIGEIKIIRTSKPLKRGYILAGNWFFGVWDSEKPPASPDSEYLRTFMANMDLNNLFGRQFLMETKQDSAYSNLPHSQGELLFPKLEYFK